MGSQIFAGTGLGVLMGLLVGLSASPVVSTVVAALSAGLIALLGFQKTTAGTTKSVLEHGSVWRLGSFGFACSAALLAGLAIRTGNLMSPSIASQLAQLTSAGYSPAEAKQWVAQKNLGETTGGKQQGSGKGPSSSVLFAGLSDDDCQTFDPDKWKDREEQLRNLESLKGKYAAFARGVRQLDSGQQAAALASVKHLFCVE
jgi:hypothetical protein